MLAIPYKKLMGLLFVFLAFSPKIYAAMGDLDTTFNSTGKVTTVMGTTNYSSGGLSAIQSDGKIVVVGPCYGVGNNDDFCVARYNTDGSLDTTFNGTGKVTTAIGTAGDDPSNVAIQSDGKIVVVGACYDAAASSNVFCTVRYNTDGSLDTTFNSTGKVMTSLGGAYNASDIAIQSDSKIVVVGHCWNSSNDDFCVVRYNTNGSLDTTFNSTGEVVTSITATHDEARGVAIQSDGKIVVVGDSFSTISGPTPTTVFRVNRYNTNGSLDTTFNSTGKVTTDIGAGADAAFDVAIQSDGKIVAVGGCSDSSTTFDFCAVRYNTNGSLDTTFNSTGKVRTSIVSGNDQAQGVAIQSDGKIVVAGEPFTGGPPPTGQFGVVRYNTDGSLDTTFSGDGMLTTSLSTNSRGESVAIQSDGNIVVSGFDWNSTGSILTFDIARYIGRTTSPTIAISNVTVNENAGTATITATMTNTPGGTVTVNYATSNGTATAGSDYTATSGTLTWNSGDATSKTFTIPITDDSLYEANETINVTLSNPTGGSVIGTGTATVTITDNDTAPTVSFTSSSQASANESGTMTVTAQLSAAAGLAVTVPYTVTGTATGGGVDYSITASPITLAAGATTGTATITITSDALDENNETVILTMGTPTNATLGSTTVHTATITDDDATPSVTFTAASQSKSENAGAVTITAQLSAASGLDITLPFTVAGTATGGGVDYTITSSPITISAGATTGTITVNIVDDSLSESNETVIVTMGTPINATQGSTTVHTLTITDNEGFPSVTFTAPSQSKLENAGAVTITAQLSTASGLDVILPFTVAGTATGGGVDYTITSSPITISAGATTGTITVNMVNDSLSENDETVIVTMGTPINANQGATTVHTVTIQNDDAGVLITESGGSTNVTEGSTSPDTYTMALNIQPTANVTLTVAPNSQVSVMPPTLTFTPDNWNIPQTVRVLAVDDDFIEGPHLGLITHTSASSDPAYNGLTIGNVTVNITDNDSAGVSIIESGGFTQVVEGGPTDTYTIALTKVPTSTVTITVSPNNQLSTNVSSVYFTPANWNVPQTITVTAIDDSIVEGNHTGTITHVSDSLDSHYKGISIQTITATITDNDTAGVSINESEGSTTVSEEGPPDTYKVVLTSQPTNTVTVKVTAGAGITANPSSLIFTPVNWNQSQTVSVAAINNFVADGTRAATISHTVSSADSHYQGIIVTNVVVTIQDNDQPGLSILETDGSTTVAEGSTSDTYSVVLKSEPFANVTMNITAGAGLTATPSSLVFTSVNWNQPQTVTVAAANSDSAVEVRSSTITQDIVSNDLSYNGMNAANITVSITKKLAVVVDETVVAKAGSSQSLIAGSKTTLNGSGSKGSHLTYQWKISKGEGSLTGETTVNPTYEISADAESQDVLILLTVTNDSKKSGNDTLTLHVKKKVAATNVEVVDDSPACHYENDFFFSAKVTDSNGNNRISLYRQNLSILLPTGSVSVRCSLTANGRLMIGDQLSNSKNKVFFAKSSLFDRSGTIDLDNFNGVPTAQSSVTALELKTKAPSKFVSQDANNPFEQIEGTNTEDQLGAFMASGDINGDGVDETLIAAPGVGHYGIIYIYDSTSTLIGTIFGSAAHPVSSIFIKKYLGSKYQDILFGPNNLALNDGLQFDDKSQLVSTSPSAFVLAGSKKLEGNIDLAKVAVDASLGSGSSYQSMTYGDIDNDGLSDLVLGTNEGKVFVYFGSNARENNRNATEADIVITGGKASDGFGQMIAVGDVTGDGINDLVIGAPDYDGSKGAIYVIVGQRQWDKTIDIQTSSRMLMISGKDKGDRMGADLVLGNDDGNGVNDIYSVKGSNHVYKAQVSYQEGGSILTSSPEGSFMGGNGCTLIRQEISSSHTGGWILLLFTLSSGLFIKRKVSLLHFAILGFIWAAGLMSISGCGGNTGEPLSSSGRGTISAAFQITATVALPSDVPGALSLGSLTLKNTTTDTVQAGMPVIIYDGDTDKELGRGKTNINGRVSITTPELAAGDHPIFIQVFDKATGTQPLAGDMETISTESGDTSLAARVDTNSDFAYQAWKSTCKKQLGTDCIPGENLKDGVKKVIPTCMKDAMKEATKPDTATSLDNTTVGSNMQALLQAHRENLRQGAPVKLSCFMSGDASCQQALTNTVGSTMQSPSQSPTSLTLKNETTTLSTKDVQTAAASAINNIVDSLCGDTEAFDSVKNDTNYLADHGIAFKPMKMMKPDDFSSDATDTTALNNTMKKMITNMSKVGTDGFKAWNDSLMARAFVDTLKTSAITADVSPIEMQKRMEMLVGAGAPTSFDDAKKYGRAVSNMYASDVWANASTTEASKYLGPLMAIQKDTIISGGTQAVNNMLSLQNGMTGLKQTFEKTYSQLGNSTTLANQALATSFKQENMGGNCANTSECLPPAFCSSAGKCGLGNTVTAITGMPGTNCKLHGNTDCASDRGILCDQYTKLCVYGAGQASTTNFTTTGGSLNLPTQGKQGSHCDQSGQCNASEGLICFNNGCYPPPTAGIAGGTPDGLSCSVKDQCVSKNCFGGRCVPQGGFRNGSPCSIAEQCASNFCTGTNGNLYCAVKGFIPLENGSQCASAAMCTSGNCSSGTCVAATLSSTKENGASCAADTQCTSGHCVNGSCVATITTANTLKNNGSFCANSTECQSKNCFIPPESTSGVCGDLSKKPDNYPCASNTECTSGKCIHLISGATTSVTMVCGH